MKDEKLKKRETVGKISRDLQIKADVSDHSADEQMQEQLVDYEDHMMQCVRRSKKDYDGNFYIVVLTKKERLMKNVLRNFFMGRKTCPTPEWDQAVYKFDRKSDSIEFMWVVPAKDVCIYMTENCLEIPYGDRELLGFVMDYNDGTLLRLSKKLNGEQGDSPLLI